MYFYPFQRRNANLWGLTFSHEFCAPVPAFFSTLLSRFLLVISFRQFNFWSIEIFFWCQRRERLLTQIIYSTRKLLTSFYSTFLLKKLGIFALFSYNTVYWTVLCRPIMHGWKYRNICTVNVNSTVTLLHYMKNYILLTYECVNCVYQFATCTICTLNSLFTMDTNWWEDCPFNKVADNGNTYSTNTTTKKPIDTWLNLDIFPVENLCKRGETNFQQFFQTKHK